MPKPSSKPVGLLNASYEYLGKLTLQRATRLLYLGKAVVEECVENKTFGPFPYPVVIRLCRYVKVNYAKLYATPRFTKRGVLTRDNYKCCYCGGKATTLDHVVPKSRGGPDSYNNIVSSCFKDNNKKANRTPQEAGMKMLYQPFTPTRAQIVVR